MINAIRPANVGCIAVGVALAACWAVWSGNPPGEVDRAVQFAIGWTVFAILGFILREKKVEERIPYQYRLSAMRWKTVGRKIELVVWGAVVMSLIWFLTGWIL